MKRPIPQREQLLDYIATQLAHHDSLHGVVAIGSVAIGCARSDSDIDAAVFMDPLDLYVMPAESLWRPADNTYHSIICDDPDLDRDAIQLDLKRLDLTVWASQDFNWPEPNRAELADGWIAYDPAERIGRLIHARTAMSDQQRLAILDEVVGIVDQTVGLADDAVPNERWGRLGAAEAFDRLQTGYEALTRGLFAYHHKWRPWRSRQLRDLQHLDWLPTAFHDTPTALITADGHDLSAYKRRAAILRSAVRELLDKLHSEGSYREDPRSEAFVRLHDEPGRAWNMDDWNTQQAERHGHR